MAQRSYRIDPSQAELWQQLQELLPSERVVDPSVWFAPEDGTYAKPRDDDLVQITRWTDPLGRRHWVFEVIPGGAYEYWFVEDYERLSWPEASIAQESIGEIALPPGWQLQRRPALAHLAGRLQTAYWRPAEGAAQFVVLCRCGLIGPPEKLLWMGTQCGACHDLEQEADPPCRPESPPADPHLLEVTPQRWLSNRIDWPEQTLHAYDPQRQRLLWQRSWLTEARFVAGHGWLLALEGREATVLDAQTGQLQTVLSSALEIIAATVLAPDQVALLHPGSVSLWSLAQTESSGAERLAIWPTGLQRAESLLASPDGEQLAVVAWNEIRLLDQAGRLLVRLQRPNAQGFREVSWQGHSIYALTPTREQGWFSRWQPDVSLPVLGQFPVAALPVNAWDSRFRVAPSGHHPQGQLVVRAERDRLFFYDGRDLQLRGELLFCEGKVDDLAFDPLGDLVLAGSDTLLKVCCRDGLAPAASQP